MRSSRRTTTTIAETSVVVASTDLSHWQCIFTTFLSMWSWRAVKGNANVEALWQSTCEGWGSVQQIERWRAKQWLTCYKQETTVLAGDCLPSPIAMSRLNNQPTGTIAEALSKLIWADARLLPSWHKPPRYVPYKGTYVPYDGTFCAPDQGQMLDVWESQTAKSALRDDWPRIVPCHTLEVVLEVTLEVILEHMCPR